MKNLAVLGGKSVGILNIPEWPIYGQEETAMMDEVIKSGIWAFRGPREKEFEKKFAEFCGTKYAVASTNGTHTLRIALEALGIGPGDEVIVPGSTWQATAAAALDVNAVPVLADIDPKTYTIDPGQIVRAITSKTRCVIPVHLYGRVCDMDAIMALAAKYNLSVLEDCSHQHGSEWRGKKVGSIGNIGSFSLQGSKILNTGEGGLLTTNDDKLYEVLQSLKTCGRPDHDGADTMQSGNYRMTEFQAGIGLTQLKRLNGQNRQRHENAVYLESRLKDIEGITLLDRDERITFQAYYHLTIKYDRSRWKNVHRSIFLEALQCELQNSVPIHLPYEPLNNSSLYRPFSKKTHKLSDEYIKRIDPERFEVPECTRAYKEDSIGFLHTLLLSTREEIDKLVLAIAKIREQVDELAEYAATKYKDCSGL